MAIAASLRGYIKLFSTVDEKILHIKLEHTCGFITLVAAYTPLHPRTKSGRQFYQKLELVVRRCPAGSEWAGYELGF